MMSEEGGVSEGVLHLCKSLLMDLLPGLLRGLFEQGDQGSGSGRDILNKTLVEAFQAQKTPNIFYRARWASSRWS